MRDSLFIFVGKAGKIDSIGACLLPRGFPSDVTESLHIEGGFLFRRVKEEC